MSAKGVIFLLFVSILVTKGHDINRDINSLEELDPEKIEIDNEIIDDDIDDTPSTTSITTSTISSTSSPSPTSTIKRNIKLCTDLSPEFLSSRTGGYQTLQCSVKICDDMDYDTDTTIRFKQPLFDWNSGLGHILVANGTCDYELGHCWHSIDIDLRYFSDQMLDNGVTELQFSCAVSDSFTDSTGNDIGWGFGSDYNSLKYFSGRGIDQSCNNDLQCGNNMFCLNSRQSDDTVCQCSVDFITGVQFVQVLDQKYGEWLCLPPLMINESCLYDQQCQAMDLNSICSQTVTIDSQINVNGKCQCNEGMVSSKTSCVPFGSEMTTKPKYIWWIFSDSEASGEHSGHRFWWLRAFSIMIAFMAIFLPIAFIFIALFVLCYKKIARSRSMANQSPIRPTFPAPKLIINDFIKKEKSDDKYGLVNNDHLNAI